MGNLGTITLHPLSLRQKTSTPRLRLRRRGLEGEGEKKKKRKGMGRERKKKRGKTKNGRASKGRGFFFYFPKLNNLESGYKISLSDPLGFPNGSENPSKIFKPMGISPPTPIPSINLIRKPTGQWDPYSKLTLPIPQGVGGSARFRNFACNGGVRGSLKAAISLL